MKLFPGSVRDSGGLFNICEYTIQVRILIYCIERKNNRVHFGDDCWVPPAVSEVAMVSAARPRMLRAVLVEALFAIDPTSGAKEYSFVEGSSTGRVTVS